MNVGEKNSRFMCNIEECVVLEIFFSLPLFYFNTFKLKRQFSAPLCKLVMIFQLRSRIMLERKMLLHDKSLKS